MYSSILNKNSNLKNQLFLKSSKLKEKNKSVRKYSLDFSNYISSLSKKDNTCIPLKIKENVKSKFYKANLKLQKTSLPNIEDSKIMPKKYSSCSKLLIYNKNSDLIAESKDNKEINKNSSNSVINFPSICQSKPKYNKKKRKSVSYFKSTKPYLISANSNNNPNKKYFLDRKFINDYHAVSLAGTDDFGNTKINQDSYLILTKINNFLNFNVFAVFDGHGVEGHLVSQFLVQYFTDFFTKNQNILKCKDEIQIYNLLSENNFNILKEAVKQSENELFINNEINAKVSGSTLCMIIQISQKIICMNIGDSRAILSVSEILREEVKLLSTDHKPYLKKEKERINKMGGHIQKCIYEDGAEDGPFRVWETEELIKPGLAISRSIGDEDASKIGVISEPEFCYKSIKKEMNFIIIASDGIWEFMKNLTVCEIIKNFYNNGNAKEAAEELVKQSRKIWDDRGLEIDDITAIVIFL